MSRSSWRSLNSCLRCILEVPKAPGASLSIPVPPSPTSAALPSSRYTITGGDRPEVSPAAQAGTGSGVQLELRGQVRCPLQDTKPCSESRVQGTPNPMFLGERMYAHQGLCKIFLWQREQGACVEGARASDPKARGQDPGMSPRSSHSQEIHSGDQELGR